MAKTTAPTKTGPAQAPASKQAPSATDLSERVPTGIDGLDELCEGGLERGSSVLCIGEPGSGKTTMMTQFLVNGALQQGEGGVFLSFEESKESIMHHSLSFGWDMNEMEKQGAVAIVNYKPHEVKRLAEEGGGMIWDTISETGAKRIAIDSLSAYVVLFDSQYQAREAQRNLFELVRKWGCTTMLSGEVAEVGGHLPAGMDYLSDAVILLHHPRQRNVRFRAIEILKMRGTNHSQKICPFEFLPGIGMRVYPGEDIFEEFKTQGF